jgi:hypothetical protein
MPWNQIGLGLINENADVLKRHYDYSKANQEAGNFHPSAESLDSSHAIAGSVNAYTVKVIPAVLPVPSPDVDPNH